jgi:hypothetical protein
MFIIELGLFSIGTIVVTTLVGLKNPISYTSLTCLNLVE